MPTMDYDCGPSRAEGQASVVKLLAAQDAAGIELTCPDRFTLLQRAYWSEL